MSFRLKGMLLLFLILCDVILTAIRPGWTAGGTVVRYIVCSVHLIVIILHAVSVFALFSGTIWFAAGLLGQLFFSVKATLPLWVLRLVVFSLPWVVDEFVSDSDFPWQFWLYGLLSCIDIISACALGVSLCFTLCALTDRTMYSPYHTEVGKEERDAVERINRGASPYDNSNAANVAMFGGTLGDTLGTSNSTHHHTPKLSLVRTPSQSVLSRNDSMTSMVSAASFSVHPPAAVTGFKLPPLALRGGGGGDGPATGSDRRNRGGGGSEEAVEMSQHVRRRRHNRDDPASTPPGGRTVTFRGEVERAVERGGAGSLVDNPSFAFN